MMQILSSGTFRRAAVLLMSFLAANASASFHLWQIDQIYSDASGGAQYIRLSTSAPSQEFVMGQNISASLGLNSRAFQFPANLPVLLPDTTAGHSFLVATQGFANLQVVAPDYIVPNGFLFLPGGSINFAGVDSVTYTALPTDGAHAITRAGTTVVASPKNFAGATGAVNVPSQAGPMDIDQNGQVDPLTDGLLLLRYMFGLRGAALIQGAVAAGAPRNTAALIEAYLAGCIAGPGSVCPVP